MLSRDENRRLTEVTDSTVVGTDLPGETGGGGCVRELSRGRHVGFRTARVEHLWRQRLKTRKWMMDPIAWIQAGTAR
jgi:hypothetical protein